MDREYLEKEYSEKEYSDLSANMRHYGNIRFAQLTIFIAITAALLKFLFGSNSSIPSIIEQLLQWGGLIITGVFLIMEVTSSYLWTRFARRAAELEKELGYHQYSTLPGAPEFKIIRPSTYAIVLFFLLVLIFWLLVIFRT